MRPRRLAIVGGASVALAVSTTFAPAVSAHTPDIDVANTSASASVDRTELAAAACRKQLANDNGQTVVSQNFETVNDGFDSQGADDFKLASQCTVTKVKVNGTYFNGAGPATSLHVTFYKNSGGSPGAIKSDQNALAYTDASGTGNFTIPLSSAVTFAAQKRFWVSVQVNMDFGTSGQWGWNTNNVAKGSNSQWRNPADGFGTGCVAYTDTATCVVAGQGPDFAFALLQ